MSRAVDLSATASPGASDPGPTVAPLSGADEIIHQPLRLRIMAVLNSLPSREPLDFTRLRASVQATDGNLGAHLSTLERAGYVQIHKDFVGKRPRTRVALTAAGGRAFAGHVAYLRELISAIPAAPASPGPPAADRG